MARGGPSRRRPSHADRAHACATTMRRIRTTNEVASTVPNFRAKFEEFLSPCAQVVNAQIPSRRAPRRAYIHIIYECVIRMHIMQLH